MRSSEMNSGDRPAQLSVGGGCGLGVGYLHVVLFNAGLGWFLCVSEGLDVEARRGWNGG